MRNAQSVKDAQRAPRAQSRGQDFNTIKQSKFIGFSMTWKHATLINLKLRKLPILHILYCKFYFLSLHVLSKSIPPVYVVQYQFQFWVGKGGLFGNFLSQFKLNKGDVFFFLIFFSILNGLRRFGSSLSKSIAFIEIQI